MAWAPDYVAVGQLQEFLRMTDSADGNEMGWAISAASRAIDAATNRQFGKVAAAEARYYTPRWDKGICRWVIDTDDICDATGLAVRVDTGSTGVYDGVLTDFVKAPMNANQKGRPWTQLVVNRTSSVRVADIANSVEVTAVYGWAAVPPAIMQATFLQASRFLARRDAPFGVAGSPTMGSEIRLLSKLDPDVAVIVKPYYRWWGAVSAKTYSGWEAHPHWQGTF